MKIKTSVNGVVHTAEYTYTGLTDETIKTYNRLLAETRRAKNENIGQCVCVLDGLSDGLRESRAGRVGCAGQKVGGSD